MRINNTAVINSVRRFLNMGVTYERKTWDQSCNEAIIAKSPEPFTWAEIRERIIWSNVFRLAFLHAGFIAAVIIYSFGLYSVPIKWPTILWAIFHGHFPGLGVTAGAHPLWTHRSYKANLPLRILLMIIYSGCGLNSLFDWIKDHRVHHKYMDTDADPHNSARGFFFSHIGWLMIKRHPEYRRRSKQIDMSDIMADPVVMLQKKYGTVFYITFCHIIPCLVPIVFWGETVMHAVLTQSFLRYVLFLHFAWSTTSVIHIWGNRPYNRNISAVENLFVCLVTMGEGSHNYHHMFPWDYKAAELPYLNFNSTTLFIDAMAKIGWATDRRAPSTGFVDDVTQHMGQKSKNQPFH